MFTIMTPVWDNVMSDWRVSNYFFFIYSSSHVYVYKSQTLICTNASGSYSNMVARGGLKEIKESTNKIKELWWMILSTQKFDTLTIIKGTFLDTWDHCFLAHRTDRSVSALLFNRVDSKIVIVKPVIKFNILVQVEVLTGQTTTGNTNWAGILWIKESSI